MLDKISRNANYCLETLSADVENLENSSDFVHAVKRKAKPSSSDTPAKRRRISKKTVIDLTEDVDDNDEEPKPKAAKSNAAKAFIKEEAADEGEGKSRIPKCFRFYKICFRLSKDNLRF